MRLIGSRRSVNGQLFVIGLLVYSFVAVQVCVAQPATKPSPEVKHQDVIVQQEYKDPTSGAATSYLLYKPSVETEPKKRSLLIYLYGAGGSIKNYNFKRKPYAKLREQLAKRGYYVMVPELGTGHFMNDAAKAKVDGIVAQVLKQQQIPASRVHVMGTSMGGGSSLAYAIHRPDLIRSVCAVVPMTDFSVWVQENPGYQKVIAQSYGGTREEIPDVYKKNSATQNIDLFEKIPVMLVHGTADRVVVYEHSQKLAELLKAKGFVCELYTVKNMAHKDDVMQEFQIQAADFFDAAVK